MNMKYEEKLIRTLKNPDGYLGLPVDDPGILRYLDGRASDYYDQGTTEGYLAAAVIYHQLTEKILLMLVQYSDLYIQATIYPEKIDLFYNDLDSFGKLIGRHKSTIVFFQKSQIIKNSYNLNKNRVQLVHKIYELGHEGKIDLASKAIRQDFESIFRDWKDALKWFYSQFSLLLSQEKLQDLLIKYSMR